MVASRGHRLKRIKLINSGFRWNGFQRLEGITAFTYVTTFPLKDDDNLDDGSMLEFLEHNASTLEVSQTSVPLSPADWGSNMTVRRDYAVVRSN